MMKLNIIFLTLVFLLGSTAFAMDNSDADQTPPTEIGKAFLRGEQQRLKQAEKQRDDATDILKNDEKLFKKGRINQSVIDADNQTLQQLQTNVVMNQAAVNQTQEALDKAEQRLSQAKQAEQNAEFSEQQAKQAKKLAQLQAKQDQDEINQKPENNSRHWWQHKDLPAQSVDQPVADRTTISNSNPAN